MRRFIQRAALFGLLIGLPWMLSANEHEANSGDSTAADASPSPARIHRHHHPKAPPSMSPAPETSSGAADSEGDASPTPARLHRHHHPKASPTMSPTPETSSSEADSEADASPSPARIHRHHHPKTSPTISPAPETSSGEADSEADVTPARKNRSHHHPVEEEDAAEASPAFGAVDGMSPATPNPRPSIAPDASLDTTQLEDFSAQPEHVQSLIEAALDLTRQNLTYNYSSADPANGGMDCSGFVYYVLTQAGLHDVPRDASEQYAWVRKAEKFRAVISRRLDGFELDELKPGDLLFWSNTYVTDRDPPVTHTMIYLGREKGTGNRVMVGSSDGRSYRGLQRWGVSVFDLKPVPASSPSRGDAGPRFIGYGSIPGL